MTLYGSLQNRLEEGKQHGELYIGMGATEMHYSDTEAYEVIAIKDAKHITVRELKATLVGDYYEQKYEYESNPNGYTKELFLSKKGWVERRPDRTYGYKFALGYARKYCDPSF